MQKMVEAMVETHSARNKGTTGTFKFIRHLSDPLCHFFVQEAKVYGTDGKPIVGKIDVADDSLFGKIF